MSNTAMAASGPAPQTGNRVSRRRWWIHLILIGGYVGVVRSLGHRHGQPILGETVASLFRISGLNLGLFALVFGLGWFASSASLEEMLLRWRPGWWVVPLGLGYSIVIRIAILLVALILSGILLVTVFDLHQLQQFWTAGAPNVGAAVSIRAMRHNPAYTWVMITFISFIVAGLREELWRAGSLAAMRALWPDTFGSRQGEMAAVVFLAIIFGLAHLFMGVIAAAMAMLIGIVLGAVMIIHRSVWPAVIAHGFFDALSFAAVAWAPLGFPGQ